MIKHLTALFLLLAALQPAALQACDMEAGQSGHGHAAMLDTGESGHDCCDPGQDAPMQDCGDALHCASCLVVPTLIAPESGPANRIPVQRHTTLVRDFRIIPHAPPLLRPPIS